MTRCTLSLAVAAALALAGTAAAQTTTMRIRGAIEAFAGGTLTVHTNAGETERIALSPGFSVSAVIPATLAAITPGTMIGIVGFGPPDHQRAAVISIFPAGASVAQVQFAWDSAPESTMTNAPVTSEVAATDGRTLTVSVKGKPVEVAVPTNAIIQTSEPGTPDQLKPGAHVIVFAQKGADGTLSAARVNVGKDGYVPGN